MGDSCAARAGDRQRSDRGRYPGQLLPPRGTRRPPLGGGPRSVPGPPAQRRGVTAGPGRGRARGPLQPRGRSVAAPLSPGCARGRSGPLPGSPGRAALPLPGRAPAPANGSAGTAGSEPRGPEVAAARRYHPLAAGREGSGPRLARRGGPGCSGQDGPRQPGLPLPGAPCAPWGCSCAPWSSVRRVGLRVPQHSALAREAAGVLCATVTNRGFREVGEEL